MILLCSLAGTALLLAGLLLSFAHYQAQPKIAVQAEPLTVQRMAYLDTIYVHGESAVMKIETDALFNLRGEDGGEPLVIVSPEETINNGLILYTLTPGTYRIFAGDLPIYVGGVYLPEGYTLPRGGVRLHWTFTADTDSSLLLSIDQVTELPENVYDVAVDPGHGGTDTGATAFGVNRGGIQPASLPLYEGMPGSAGAEGEADAGNGGHQRRRGGGR